MPWDEISGDCWTIPQERHKGRLSHRVPLSPQALEVLESIRPITGDARHVFDSPHRPGHPLSTMKTANWTILRRTGMKRWTPHDLRRTAATHMTSGGVSPFVVERVLGHAHHGIAAVYDRSSYDRDKHEALNWWGIRLQQIASGDVDSEGEGQAHERKGTGVS